MNLSYQWLKDYLKLDETPEFIAEKITTHAQEVADVRPLFNATHLTFGTVLKSDPIEGSKNKKCLVDTSRGQKTIVCGASNVAAGQTVIVALEGAVLPGGKMITKTHLNGVDSEGMICSLAEVGIDAKFIQEEGIHVIKGLGQGPEVSLEDAVIELDLTPNRMDLLSVFGCAYEVGALLNLEVTPRKVNVKESQTLNPYTIEIKSKDCPAYYGRMIENVTVQDSPEWLKMRLIAAGIRPINNIVDVTNYVMIDLGQPLHAFDADKLSSKIIKVRNAKPKEKIMTLDQHERTLLETDLLITDNDTPIALGGVMGGFDSEVTGATKTLFLESAMFEPKTISKTSRRLDLRSESSLRFERGVSPDRVLLALDYAASLMAELSGGTVAKGIAQAITLTSQERIIEVSLENINGLLGTALESSEVLSIFKRLAIPAALQGSVFKVTVPPRRLDIEIAQDLVEEVGRIMGYDHLPAKFPETITEGALSSAQKKRRQIKTHLEALGFNEVITYSLGQEKNDQPFIAASDPITILRPINEANQTLKQSVIPSLLDVLSYHQARQMDAIQIYEWAKTYQQKTEKEVLGLAWMGSAYQPSWQTDQAVGFYHVKGIVEQLLFLYGLTAEFIAITQEGFHPHQAAQIKVAGEVIGQIGQVHPLILRSYDLDAVYVAELEVAKLQTMMPSLAPYKPVPKVPSVKRDIAIKVPLEMPVAILIQTIQSAPVDALTSVEVTDVYQGSPLSADEKSVTLRLWFNKGDQTFKAEAIEALMTTIENTITTTLNVTLRT